MNTPTLKLSVCLVMFFSFVHSFSQVGIGTTTPLAGVSLQIDGGGSGLLINRVALTGTEDVSTVSTLSNPNQAINHEGLMVYNTATAGTAPNNVSPGLYYWTSSEWRPVSSGSTTTVNEANIPTGAIYVSTSLTTTISTANTPVKVAGNTTSIGLVSISTPSDNRMVYTGTETRFFQYTVSISFTAANNRTFRFSIAKGSGAGAASVITSSKQPIRTLGSPVHVSLTGLVELATDDYLEVWVENNTNADNLTVDTMSFVLR